MKRLSISVSLLVLCVGAATGLRAADVNMNVVAAFAPNGRPLSQSPSWPQYVTNATTALQNSYSVVGDRLTNPTAYETITAAITPLEMFYTNATPFEVWRGLADPNPSFGSLPTVFQTETGNNVQFGLRIESDGSVDFALHDLSWQLDSNDSTNYFDQAGDFSAADYSATRIGINYGADNSKGTGDDLIYNNGEAGSLSIHELVYVGIGEGFEVTTADGPSDQEAIANLMRTLLTDAANTTFNLSAIYTLTDPGGGSPIIASQSIEVVIPAGVGGDFNFDKDITAADKDLLTQVTAAGTHDVLYDLTDDSLVNFDDLEYMVHQVAGTSFGDADCNGLFNSSDLIQVMAFGLYETGDPAVWSSGDFDGNGVFESTDLILALADGGYDQFSAVAVVVPEPSTLVLTLIGLGLAAARLRRR